MKQCYCKKKKLGKIGYETVEIIVMEDLPST